MTANRRLAAIMVADVVGYSRMMEADEVGTLDALKQRRKEVLEPVVKGHGGRIVKVMGDGVLVEFSSAVNAVQGALELQKRMAAANEDAEGTKRLDLRIGINLGDVIGEGSDIYGDGVNVAARLEPLAEAGAIAISGQVYDAVRGKVGVTFEDMGEQSLKNIGRRIQVYKTVGSAGKASAAAENNSRLLTVAVLPFTNMSSDAEQEYFADGLTEDLITALSKSKHLAVLSRNATFQYRNRAVNIPEVGKQLGADHVVEGSVRKGGGRVRVTAQLIDARSGAHAWAEQFDRELSDIFAVQDEIVASIAGQLAYGLVDAGVAGRGRVPTTNLSAYDHLLRGRAAWRRGASLETRAHYQKAVDLDPNFSAALAALAFFFGYDIFWQTTGEAVDVLARLCRELAERAIRADDGDSFTHHSVGTAFICLGELDKAKHHLEMAILLNPHYPSSRINLGLTLVLRGQHLEGLKLAKKGLVMEPRLPPAMRAVEMEIYCVMGDNEAAQAAFDHIDGPLPLHYLVMAACHAHKGDNRRAERARAEFESRRPASFDLPGFIRFWSNMYWQQEDKERLLDGFRKLGLTA